MKKSIMYSAIHRELIFSELERFGPTEAGKIHFSHNYRAFKSGPEKFLESGSHYSACPIPDIETRNLVKERKIRYRISYSAEYIEEQNRILAEKEKRAETEECPF